MRRTRQNKKKSCHQNCYLKSCVISVSSGLKFEKCFVVRSLNSCVLCPRKLEGITQLQFFSFCVYDKWIQVNGNFCQEVRISKKNRELVFLEQTYARCRSLIPNKIFFQEVRSKYILIRCNLLDKKRIHLVAHKMYRIKSCI